MELLVDFLIQRLSVCCFFNAVEYSYCILFSLFISSCD